MGAIGKVKDRQSVTRQDLEGVISDIEKVIDHNKSLRRQISQPNSSDLKNL